MRPPLVLVRPDARECADFAAAQLVTRLVEAQADRGHASVVLTGGTMGALVLRSIALSPARDAVDWRRLDVWWGDERFVPSGHPDRNETQAREALLDWVPLDPGRVHPMAGPDTARDVEEAAERYADVLADVAAAQDGPRRTVPAFDVVMLGVGPDAHVASLFPELPGVRETTRPVVGVRGAPKPPPHRVSLTLPALSSGVDVAFLVAGADKAPAVALALSGAGPWQAPAAGVSGTRSTTWFLDRAAAAHVPPELIRPAEG